MTTTTTTTKNRKNNLFFIERKKERKERTNDRPKRGGTAQSYSRVSRTTDKPDIHTCVHLI
jgi:hypothetical protein